jgi:hypothetical protein
MTLRRLCFFGHKWMWVSQVIVGELQRDRTAFRLPARVGRPGRDVRRFHGDRWYLRDVLGHDDGDPVVKVDVADRAGPGPGPLASSVPTVAVLNLGLLDPRRIGITGGGAPDKCSDQERWPGLGDTSAVPAILTGWRRYGDGSQSRSLALIGASRLTGWWLT